VQFYIEVQLVIKTEALVFTKDKMGKPVQNKLKKQHREDRIWHTKHFKDRKRESKTSPKTQFEDSYYDYILDEDYWS